MQHMFVPGIELSPICQLPLELRGISWVIHLEHAEMYHLEPLLGIKNVLVCILLLSFFLGGGGVESEKCMVFTLVNMLMGGSSKYKIKNK